MPVVWWDLFVPLKVPSVWWYSVNEFTLNIITNRWKTFSTLTKKIWPKVKRIRKFVNIPKSFAFFTQSLSVIIKPFDFNQSTSVTKPELLQNTTLESFNLVVSKIKNAGRNELVFSYDKSWRKKIKKLITSNLAGKYQLRKISDLHPKFCIVRLFVNLFFDDILR